ncbi:nose resistant to fluoxetine protein 6-like [Brevipalpus obovatus]|uniref:nose resistant to fluoxetine protein 6-like n=1 Tax=Brevipalpus obovatus TaxID=246614 RepID=UPI003D9F2CAB
MESLRSGVLMVILMLLSSSYIDGVLEVIFNKVLPRFEGESFAKSFYLSSRVSLLPLNLFLQNSTGIAFHSPVLDELSAFSREKESTLSKSSCAFHLKYIIETIWSNQGDTSVLGFLDSFAKPAPGVIGGNLDWNGNQRQCESTSVSSGSRSNFVGKYCKAEWRTKFDSNHSLSHYTGICVPSTCSGKDFEYLKLFLEKFFFLKISEKSKVVEISCKGETNLTIDSIIFYLICFGLILLGIMSTVYEKYFEKTPKKSKENSGPSIFSIFSIPRNWKSLDGRRVSKNDILIIHYIKSFAAVLVTLFHSITVLSAYLVSDPGAQLLAAQGSFIFWVLPRTFMAIFFFLTGFLIRPDSNPFKSIFRAFIRLSPSYYLTMFAHTSYINTIGLGPKIDFGGVLCDRDHCSKVFWKSLLYIQNFSPTSEGCNISLWSLAVTFQLYIIGVFVVWLILRVPFIGISSAILVMIHGMAMSYKYFYDTKLVNIIGVQNEAMNFSSLKEYGRFIVDSMDNFNVRTSIWLCPLIMGILFAYLLPKIQRAPYPSQKKCVMGILSLIASFLAIFCLIINLKISNLTASFLQAISPIGTGLILSLIICIFHPESKLINYKLSSKTSPLLVHISRLSYTIYLTHYAIFVTITNSTSLTPMLDTFSILCIFAGSFIIVYFVSVFLYILVERPIQNIRKIMNI